MKSNLSVALIFALLIITIVACSKFEKGTPVGDKDLETGPIVLLFEVDGVKVYRFTDGGEERYFATGPGTYLPSVLTESNGKGSSHKWSDGAVTTPGSK